MRRFEGSRNDYEAGRPGRLDTNPEVLLVLVAVAVLMTATAAAPARAATKQAPVLAEGAGMSGKPSAAVRHVQRVLRSRGYSLGRPGADGRFGPLTAAAVRLLQSDRGLTADGIVGPQTRKVVRGIERRAQRPSSTHKARGSRTSTAGAQDRRHAPSGPGDRGHRADGGDPGLVRTDCGRARRVLRRSRARAATHRAAAQSAGASCRSRTSSISRATAPTRASAASAAVRWPPRSLRRPAMTPPTAGLVSG